MAFVMVGIMIICCKQSRSFVAVIMMGNTVMVVIVDVIQRHRFNHRQNAHNGRRAAQVT